MKPKYIRLTWTQSLELAFVGRTELSDGTVIEVETIGEQRARERGEKRQKKVRRYLTTRGTFPRAH